MSYSCSQDPEHEAAMLAHQQAWLQSKPRWQTIARTLSGLSVGILVPGIAFCGWLSASFYAGAIAATLFVTSLAYALTGVYLTRNSSPSDRRIDDFVLSSILLATAATLMASVAFQTGPLRDREIDFGTALTVTLAAACAGAAFMRYRVKQHQKLVGSHRVSTEPTS